MGPSQYQLAYNQPSSYSPYASWIANPYTTNAYTNPNSFASTSGLTAASLQQSQIIPFTSSPSNSFLFNPAQYQPLNFAIPQSSTAAIQPLSYTTASPLSSVSKVSGTTVVTPTTPSFYPSAPTSQSYQQSPAYRKINFIRFFPNRESISYFFF